MEPNFFDGDRVVTFNWTNFRVNDAVVFRYKTEIYIKRVKKIIDNKVFVEGDNNKLSSRVDPINTEQIIGKVVWSY